MPSEQDSDIHIHVGSILSSRTHQGLVELEVGPTKVQMSVQKARQIGLWLVQSAESAQSDEAIYKLCSNHHLGDELAAQMVG